MAARPPRARGTDIEFVRTLGCLERLQSSIIEGVLREGVAFLSAKQIGFSLGLGEECIAEELRSFSRRGRIEILEADILRGK